MLTQPDTIIFDASISGYHEIEKALRKEKGLENVSFILLGEGQDLESLEHCVRTNKVMLMSLQFEIRSTKSDSRTETAISIDWMTVII